MHKFTHKPSVWDHFLGFQQSVANRIVWPYSFEKDSLVRWRANILASILIVGLITGVFAFGVTAALIVEKNAWGLAFVDSLGVILCLFFLFVHHIRYEIRAGVSVLAFYVIGMAIIISVGPLSGGPAWLFAFAVIAGVLMGNYAAFGAIILNAVFLAVTGWLFSTGRWGHDVVFFTSPQAMAAAGVNFIALNAITAVSVSTLVKGLFQLFKQKEELAEGLETERTQLIQTKHRLESEITERKSAQTEKIQALTLAAEAQRLALVGQVAGKMAHDFNNILGVVMGTAELAMLDCPHEQTSEYLQLIFDQTIRGKNLTKNLVVFARDQELKQEFSAVDDEIAGAGIETYITNKQILVVEDEPAILDVLSKILSREPCHHTVDTAEDGPAAMDLLAKNQYDLISLDYILPGNLTGMDIYRHIRERHKTVPVLFVSGNIEFLESIKELQQKDPHIDHVSKPCMNIDYVKIVNHLLLHQVSEVYPETDHTPEPRAGSLAQKGLKKENAALPGGDEHILLVDDEIIIVELQTQILGELGYTITSFTDPLAAVEGFQANPEGFDLVITDMDMPHMSGAKLAGEMIAIRSDIPIIMCTGFSDRISEETAKYAGIKRLLMKPVLTSDLAGSVRKVLDKDKK
ncbi:MAG: response regulator [Desulfotignum sp.]|nr:response regulator [Desulfobacteraceae bacterium]